MTRSASTDLVKTMDKNELRRKRDSAVTIKLDLEEGDRIVEWISRGSGLHAIALNKILRLQSPNILDPDLEYPDTPWDQSVYLPHGSTDPFVARTILQTNALANAFFGGRAETHEAMMDISWEVLSSLVSLRMTKEKLDETVSNITAVIDADLDAYTKGSSPKPLPIVEYYDIQFRSFVNEVRRVLSTISNLFAVLTSENFSMGRFDKALEWARIERGEEHPLTNMLRNDQIWIKTWIDMRIAIEHPKTDRFIETLNFVLQPDRIVRLPTWRFLHPDYNMGRPQNLLEVFDTCIDNILKFYEDLQVALVDGHLPTTVKIGVEFIDEEDRDPETPMLSTAE